MNYNILGYSLYLIFTVTIIFKVGLICYKHGKVYSLQIFNGNIDFTERINKILLVCYYLYNIGYCLITIYSWQKMDSWQLCFEAVCTKAGLILITLGVLHFINIFVIIYISQKHKFSSPLN